MPKKPAAKKPSGNKLSGVERARHYHYASVQRNRKELQAILDSGEDSLISRIRVRELEALIERENEELQVVEQARELGLMFTDVALARREISNLQREDRRKAILDLIRANAIQGLAQLQMMLAQQGFRSSDATVSNDIKVLGVVKYRPEPTAPLRYVQLTSDPDMVTQQQLIEFALSNATTFALQEIRRKGDRLYLSCTHRTAGHLADALAERMVPDIISILSDGYSTIWVECDDEEAARGLETMLRRYLIFGG